MARDRLRSRAPVAGIAGQGRQPHAPRRATGYADLGPEGPDLRFKRGDTAEVAFGNELPLPSLLNWRGLDGAAAIDPLTARAPLASGGKEALQVPLRNAGTFLCDVALLGDGQARPSRARALVVGENEAVTVDRDEVLLIEDWRLRADGTAIAPDRPEGYNAALYRSMATSFDISAGQ